MVDWATVLTSVTLSVVGSVIVTEYQLQREQSIEDSQEIDQWYTETAECANELKRTWNRLLEAEYPNVEELQSELSLLEGKISRHATKGQQLDVDNECVVMLDKLAQECREIGEFPVHHGSLSEIKEREEDIFEISDQLTKRVEEK